MTNPRTLPNPLLKKTWVAVRFVLFGVLGFLVMFGSWVMLLALLLSRHHENGEMSPFLLAPLTFLGALMMLFGVGEWGRWAYLLVFLSIPFSFLLLFLVPTPGKEVGVIVPSLAAVSTYMVVRRHYARRKRRNSDTT
jgi:putative flippase GtrA